MSELLTLQDLANGHLDVKALGEAANGDENTIVITRTGNTYPSAKKAISEGITNLFENGGLPATPFKTKALMELSSLSDGDYAVVTDDGDSNGLYIKDGGVWNNSEYDLFGYVDKKLEELQAELKNSQGLGYDKLIQASSPHPVEPVYDFIASSRDELGLINLANISPPTKNILPLCSGEIRNYSNYQSKSDVTRYYADGIVSKGTAAKVVVQAGSYDSDSTTPFVLVKDMPSGKAYNVKFIIRTESDTATIGVGTSSKYSDMTEFTINTSYKTIEYFISKDSSRVLYIKANMEPVTFIIDEIQVYEDIYEIPPFEDELSAGNRLTSFNFGNSIGINDSFISPNSDSFIRSPNFPFPKKWDEITIIVTTHQNSPNEYGGGSLVAADSDDLFNTHTRSLNINLYPSSGVPAFAPSLISDTSISNLLYLDSQILGMRNSSKSEKSSSFLEEVSLTGESARSAPEMQANVLNVFGGRGTAAGYRGRVVAVTVYDKYLGDAEYYQAVKLARARASIIANGVKKTNWLIGEGDSVTANRNSFTNIQHRLDHGGYDVQVLNLATGGNPLGTLVGRLPVLKKRVDEIKLAGHNPVVSVLIAGNDHASLRGESGYYSPQEYYQRLVSYWESVRALGVKLIACTALAKGFDHPHMGENREYERGRLIYNDLIRSDPSKYDALADFGDVNTLMGMPNSPNINPEYWSDLAHPNEDGYLEMSKIFKPVLNGLLR